MTSAALLKQQRLDNEAKERKAFENGRRACLNQLKSYKKLQADLKVLREKFGSEIEVNTTKYHALHDEIDDIESAKEITYSCAFDDAWDAWLRTWDENHPDVKTDKDLEAFQPEIDATYEQLKERSKTEFPERVNVMKQQAVACRDIQQSLIDQYNVQSKILQDNFAASFVPCPACPDIKNGLITIEHDVLTMYSCKTCFDLRYKTPWSIAGKLAADGYTYMASGMKGYWIKNMDGLGVVYESCVLADITAAARQYIIDDKNECSEKFINEALNELRDINHLTRDQFTPDKNVMAYDDCIHLVDKNETVSTGADMSSADFEIATRGYQTKSLVHVPHEFPSSENFHSLYMGSVEDERVKFPKTYAEYIAVQKRWDLAMNQYFSGDPIRIRILQNFCGLLLYRTTEIKKALFCIGPINTNPAKEDELDEDGKPIIKASDEHANAGKTTLFNIIAHAIGEKNVFLEDFELFCKNQFASSADADKLVVCVDELPKSTRIDDISKFKTSVGNKKARSEKKNFDPENVSIFYKWWVNMNDLFYLPDIDTDFTKKVLMLIFDARFTEIPSEVNGKQKIYPIDRTFEATMTTPVGTYFILQWMLEGQRDLLANNGEFVGAMNAREVLDFWIEHTDILHQFVKNECVLEAYPDNQKAYMTKDKFMDALGNYARKIHWRRKTPEKKTVTIWCHKYGFYAASKRMEIDGRKKEVEIYAGIRLKTENERQDEEIKKALLIKAT